MTWLDLEGTLIDDLSSRKWLDISKIVLLKSNFGIFTWGWWDQSEVDWDLIHSIEEKFSATRSDVLATKCVKVITKKDCMDFMFQKGLWSYDGWENEFADYKNIECDKFQQCCAEEHFNSNWSKETCFIEMFKHEKLSWLYDDTIRDNKRITFIDNDNIIVLLNPLRI